MILKPIWKSIKEEEGEEDVGGKGLRLYLKRDGKGLCLGSKCGR